MRFHPGSDRFHGRLGAIYNGEMFWVRLYHISWIVRPHPIVLHVVAQNSRVTLTFSQLFNRDIWKEGNVANNDVLHDLRAKMV